MFTQTGDFLRNEFLLHDLAIFIHITALDMVIRAVHVSMMDDFMREELAETMQL